MQDKKAVLCFALGMLIILPAITSSLAFIRSDGSEDSYFEIFGPRIDKLVIRKYANLDAEMTALQNGEIDITDWPLNATWMNTLASDPNIGIAYYGGETGYYSLNFNNNNNTYLGNPPNSEAPNPVYPNPMSSDIFRQCVSTSINNTYLCQVLAGGMYEPIYTPIPAYMTYWIHPDIKPGGLLENLTWPYDGPTFANSNAKLTAYFFPVNPSTCYRYWDRNHDSVEQTDERIDLKIYTRADILRKSAGNMEEAGLTAMHVRFNRTEVTGGQAYQTCMVEQNYHSYTSGWINLGPEPDYLYDLYSYDNYWWDPSNGPSNWAAIGQNNPAQNDDLWTLKLAADVPTALAAARTFQEKFAADACEKPLAVTSAPKAYNKWYTGGNNGTPVDPDDGENKYRGHAWEGIANEKGVGENSWFTSLNAYPQDHAVDDGNMIMRYGWERADMPIKLNPIFSSWQWEFEVLGRIFDTLGSRDPYTNGPGEIPRLVDNWTVGVWTDSNDGLEKSKITLTIRPDIYWSDGTPFTIEDIIYNLIDLYKELTAKGAGWSIWCPIEWWTNVLAYYRLDKYSVEILMRNKLFSAMDEVFLLTYPLEGFVVPKHLWQPFIASHNAAEIMGDLSATHPEMLVGTGPFIFGGNTTSTLTLIRNPLYYQRMNNAAIRYAHSGESNIVEGITVTALPPSTQIRPFKVKPGSWTTDGEARLTIPITNLDTRSSVIIHEKIELQRPGGVNQTLLEAYDQTLTALQINLETFELHDLEKGEHAIRVTIEVTGGELYDYVTSNLPPELWHSTLGPKTVEKHFWVTTLADVNEDGVVNILDISKVATQFGLIIGQPGFDTMADVNLDHKINILDIVKIALDYSWHY
jgi:Bacterial extracellular solute-binding proteins, family 5 Middle/Dockerin type I domain